MRVAETIGKVTLNKCHPSVQGATWLLAVPLTLEGLAGQAAGRGEPFVVFDELGAGCGSRIAVSEGAEAAAPFYPATKPIDAYNAAILDNIEFELL
jgi:ethanolamine utilization protein EutN